jgi:hypothetical protein
MTMVALARPPRATSVLVSSKCAESGELSMLVVVEIVGWPEVEDVPVHALSSKVAVAATAAIAIEKRGERATEGLEFEIMFYLLTAWMEC